MWLGLAVWFCRSKCVGPCGLSVALPPPTLRPADKTDHGFFGSFVRINVGSVSGCHGLSDVLRLTLGLAAHGSVRIRGLVSLIEQNRYR